MANKFTIQNATGLDMISVNIFHVSLMVFLVLCSLITLLSFAFPPRSLLSNDDFMMRSSTPKTGDVKSNDKNKGNQRLSRQGKRKLLGWSVLFAFIIAFGVHLLHLYVL